MKPHRATYRQHRDIEKTCIRALIQCKKEKSRFRKYMQECRFFHYYYIIIIIVVVTSILQSYVIILELPQMYIGWDKTTEGKPGEPFAFESKMFRIWFPAMLYVYKYSINYKIQKCRLKTHDKHLTDNHAPSHPLVAAACRMSSSTSATQRRATSALST